MRNSHHRHTRSLIGAVVGLLVVMAIPSTLVVSASAPPQETEGSLISIVAGQLNWMAPQDFPSSFGDIRVDNATEMTVYTVGPATALIARINGIVKGRFRVDYVPVRYSAQHLRALAERMAADTSSLYAAGVPIEMLVPDARQGVVDVTLQTPVRPLSRAAAAAGRARAQATLDARYGAGTFSIQPTTQGLATLTSNCPTGCRTDDFTPFFGGDSITFETSTEYVWCSSGFGVRDSNGDQAVLSAGHCAPPGIHVSVNCAPPPKEDFCPESGTLGSVGPSYYTPNVGLDFEAIDVSASSFDVYGGSPTSTNPPVYSVEGTVQEPTNDCCLTVDGASTGEITGNKVVNSWTCVTIQFNGAMDTECGLGEVVNNTNPNLRIIQGGDSGGPVFEHDWANGNAVLAEGILTIQDDNGAEAFFEQLSVVLSGATGITIDES
jgi:hypothetical protein